MADMAIFQVQGPDSVMQSGASPGSSVGDTNDWILFLWFILIVFCPWFRSATSHRVQNTQNHRFFDPKHHFLTNERPKIKKINFFKKVRNLLSHDAGDCRMACLSSEWGLFGRQKRTWATWGKTTTYPHDTGKIGHFFKIGVFHETWVGLGVDGPHKTAEHLQNTPKARLPLGASGSQSAL